MLDITYRQQLRGGIILLLLMHICSTLFHNGIFVNIAWVLYGLSFILHPVCPERAKEVKNIRLWVRFGGLLCVIIGLITRFGV